MHQKSKLGIENFQHSTATPPDVLDLQLPSYRLAYTDRDFLKRDELRGVRFQLELQKPELAMQELGVHSTVVIFGSARVADPRSADAAGDGVDAELDYRRSEGLSQSYSNGRYYEAARVLARLITQYSLTCAPEQCMHVMTGGGPGIMEAANRGAADVNGKSIGLNIVLPKEQHPNPYISPEFCFRFHYFGIRKMHFMMRARALVVFPGGFGTLDELFDALTLIQTGKSLRVPVILLGRDFWRNVINFEFLAEQGMIDVADLDLISYVETAEEAWTVISDFYDLNAQESVDEQDR